MAQGSVSQATIGLVQTGDLQFPLGPLPLTTGEMVQAGTNRAMLRIDQEGPLIGEDRLVNLTPELMDLPYANESRLKTRKDIQGRLKGAQSLVIAFSASVKMAEKEVGEGGAGLKFEEALKDLNAFSVLPHLREEGAQIEVGLSGIRVSTKDRLILGDGVFPTPQPGVDPSQQLSIRQMVWGQAKGRLRLGTGSLDGPLAEKDRGQDLPQDGRVRICADSLLIGVNSFRLTLFNIFEKTLKVMKNGLRGL
jgi:hypothetical protein